MTSPACTHHRFLIVLDSDIRPTASEHVGVCEACGTFLVRLRAGKSQVVTTFRLTARQVKAAAKSTQERGPR